MDPKFKLRETKKFANTSSEDINEMHKEIRSDIKRIYDSIIDTYGNLTTTNNRLKHEVYFLNKQMSSLENEVEYLNENIEENICYKDFINDNGISYSDYKADVYEKHSVLTPHAYAKIPKTYKKTLAGESFVPDDLSVTVNEDKINKDTVSKKSTNPKNCLDQSLESVWFQEYNYDKNVADAEITLEITLPEKVFTNRLSNCLIIEPYPNQECKVKEIQYKAAHNSDYKTFDIANKYSQDIFHIFPEKEITNLKITFTNSNMEKIYDDNEYNKHSIILGAKNIALYKIKFAPESGIRFPLDIPEDVQKINDIDIYVSNKEVASDFEYRILGGNPLNNTENEIDIGENISTNFNSDLYIEFSFTDFAIAPVIQYFTIKYEI